MHWCQVGDVGRGRHREPVRCMEGAPLLPLLQVPSHTSPLHNPQESFGKLLLAWEPSQSRAEPELCSGPCVRPGRTLWGTSALALLQASGAPMKGNQPGLLTGESNFGDVERAWDCLTSKIPEAHSVHPECPSQYLWTIDASPPFVLPSLFPFNLSPPDIEMVCCAGRRVCVCVCVCECVCV